MRRTTLAPFAFGALALAAFAPSCGGNTKSSGFTPVDGGSSDGPVLGSSGGGSGGLIGDGSGGDGGCENHCSSDLHSLVDCHGNVLMTCPASEGCAGTSCVPACTSAADNKSTFGCEYYSVDPDVIPTAQGACFALFIANTWTSAVTIKADWGGQPIDVSTAAQIPSGSGTSLSYTPLGTGGLQPGQVAILFLNDWPPGYVNLPPLNYACPTGVTAAFTSQDGAVHGTAMGKAFHVTTDVPVVAYDIFPYGGGQSAATSATLLIPTSAWDVNYIAVNAFQKDVLVKEADPFTEVVAAQADTTVSISPTSAIVGGTGVAATAQGQTGKYVLANPGDYVQFTQGTEITGSPILADKPVGVWGGATCLNISTETCCCDSAHQQLFPVKTLGHEYVATRYPDRITGMPETTPWRFVGAVKGTTLKYEPSTPTGAPTTLDVGQVVTLETIAPFVVSSQDSSHPFYLSAHMTGAETLGKSASIGDPEFVNVIPPAEFLTSYVFFTDPTYPETHLVLNRVKGPGGFEDVKLDCLPSPGLVTGWLPVGSSGNYEYANVTLSSGNYEGQNGCNNGRHTITSTQPFGLTVWGWGSPATGAIYSEYVSYAYPAGASVQPINTVVVPPGAQ